MWLSLVEHCVRDAGAARSNRAIPTRKIKPLGEFAHEGFCFSRHRSQRARPIGVETLQPQFTQAEVPLSTPCQHLSANRERHILKRRVARAENTRRPLVGTSLGIRASTFSAPVRIGTSHRGNDLRGSAREPQQPLCPHPPEAPRCPSRSFGIVPLSQPPEAPRCPAKSAAWDNLAHCPYRNGLSRKKEAFLFSGIREYHHPVDDGSPQD